MAVLGMAQAHCQFFAQQIDQMNINGAEEAYIVIATGDTISGTISRVWYQDSLISKVRLKTGEDRLDFPIENIQTLAVIPDDFSPMEETGLNPVLKSLKNKEFIEALPEGDYVYFEKIRDPSYGRQEVYVLAQLLNKGWDDKIKVYRHPRAEIQESTRISFDIALALVEDRYYVSVGGDPVIEFMSQQYRRRAMERIFNHCPELAKKKRLKWKEFAEDVFTHFQYCL